MNKILYLTIIALLIKNNLQYNHLIFDEDDLESLIDLTPQNDKQAKIVLPSAPIKNKVKKDDSVNNSGLKFNDDTLLEGYIGSNEIKKVMLKQADSNLDDSEEAFCVINKFFLFIIALFIM